jgi:hypothetical protein
VAISSSTTSDLVCDPMDLASCEQPTMYFPGIVVELPLDVGCSESVTVPGRLRQLSRLFGVEPSVVGTDEHSERGGLDVVNSIASCFARLIRRGGAKS